LSGLGSCEIDSDWLRNSRKLQATLERLCEINHKLLRPETQRYSWIADERNSRTHNSAFLPTWN
jgi:hypothetical protein